MQSLYNYTRSELADLFAEKEFKFPAYRIKQIFDWLYISGVSSIDAMTNLSKADRTLLKSHFSLADLSSLETQKSADGTVKFLFPVDETKNIETVLIAQKHRKTLCVSSQYGCGMGCKFCQTGTMGFQANLSTAAIVGQFLTARKYAVEIQNDRIHNLVFMGMGEPLHNYKNVVKALYIISDPEGLNFSPRRITVSSVGLVPAIEKFAKEDLTVNLAVSLNATTDSVRDHIMPINQRFNIARLISTLHNFPSSKRRKITIEYVLLAGVNDTREDMLRLPGIIKGLDCRVNLIPYNDNSGLGYSTPEKSNVERWQNHLEHFFPTTVRWSKGGDIDAACGQLATKTVDKKKTALQIAD